MARLHDRIQTVAAEFASHVLDVLRRMTLDELLDLTRLRGVGDVVLRSGRTAQLTRPDKPKRRITMTPKLKAARKLQGQYMGLLRKFSGAKRQGIKKIAQQDSVAAAVAAMRKQLGRS